MLHCNAVQEEMVWWINSKPHDASLQCVCGVCVCVCVCVCEVRSVR